MSGEQLYLYRWEIVNHWMPEICRRGATLEEIALDYFRVTFAT